MWKYVKEIAKAGATMFAVGVLLAIAAPALAATLENTHFQDIVTASRVNISGPTIT